MKSKRALVIGLVISIALNLVAVGIFLGSQTGPRPEMQRIDPVFGLRRLLGEVPEERAQALAPLYREYFSAMRPRFREIRATQAALRSAMLTEPLDEAALRSAMQSFESQLRGSQQASQDAFVALAAAQGAEVEEGSGGQKGSSSAGAGAGEQQAVTNGMAMLELVRFSSRRNVF